jgi:ribosomal protein L16 Arg81 hydroxylase
MTVPFGWRRWAAASLLSGMATDDVVSTMVRDGIDADAAAQACDELVRSPAYAAGGWATQRLNKLESTLAVLTTLHSLNGHAIPQRRHGVSAHEFLSDYYSVNRPVVLTDVTDGWPALRKWNPAYLKSVIGDHEVEVMAERNNDPNYERRAGTHRRTMRFSEYADKLADIGTSNDYYLVANNHLLERECAEPLWQDFRCDERYLTPAPPSGTAFLWFGPGGTYTPLHHDVMNVLFVQVAGRKEFTLISPLASPCVANNVGVYADVDPREPDLDRFPRFKSARPVTVTVNPGEALFIPVGWWHAVTALDVSISLTFTNFVHQNRFTWRHPDIRF